MSRSRNPRELLVRHVQELEQLEEEKLAAADAFRAAMKAAQFDGFDAGTLRVVLRLRKMTPGQRQERRALEALYMAALGMLDGDALPESARRRLDEPEPTPEAQAPPVPKGARPGANGQARTQERGAARPPAPQRALQLKDPEEARQEGRQAASAGKRIYDNPYSAGDPCRAAWDEGWCAKNKSHGMETPEAFRRRTPKEPGKDSEQPGKGDA